MATNTADRASALIERWANDPQFRESIEAAPTLHAKAELVKAAGYGDLSLDGIQEALKDRLIAAGAGVQVDPARAQRAEELFFKVATDAELSQALQNAATPEAKREVLAQAGYGDITVDDLRAGAARIGEREELSDEELELVSGGGPISQEAWLGSAMPMAAAAGGLGFAVGGPPGAVVGAIVGFTAAFVGAFAIPDPPPPSQW